MSHFPEEMKSFTEYWASSLLDQDSITMTNPFIYRAREYSLVIEGLLKVKFWKKLHETLVMMDYLILSEQRLLKHICFRKAF